MRLSLIVSAAVASIALAGAAQAQPPEVSVTLGADLAEEAEEDLGIREVERQAVELVQTVREELGRRGRLEGSKVRLVLTDLKPNRPTMEQMSDRPALSMESISIGGAAIEGEVIAADGSVRKVAYDYFSPNLHHVIGGSTWQDADRAFETFARRLAEGDL